MKKRSLLFSSSLFMLFLVQGCATASQPLSDKGMESYFYYTGKKSEKIKMRLPVKTEKIYKIQIFDQKISYRDNKKASLDFTLPNALRASAKKIEMNLEAYNDDSHYLRAVWFEIDGFGGYINVKHISPGQVRGSSTLGRKQRKKWTFDLSDIHLSAPHHMEQQVNAFNILTQAGMHTLRCWISTYEQYGPHSWISLELIFKQ